jgi:hypothetical protein
LEPVVVPVGQEVAYQISQTHRIQVSRSGQVLRLGEPAGERDQVAHVDLDAGIEREQGRSG